MRRCAASLTGIWILAALSGYAQTVGPAYQPKFAGDKARSQAEASALGYMRTVATAQKLYKRKHGQYANSLAGLVGSGSFTKRMTKTDRGDYVVSFKSKPDGYALVLTPRQFEASRRGFYMEEDGMIRAEETRSASAKSPPLK
jgi:hypothetical protein